MTDYTEERLEELGDEAVEALAVAGFQFSNECGNGAFLMQNWHGEARVREIEVRAPDNDDDEWAVLVTYFGEWPETDIDSFLTLTDAVVFVATLAKKASGSPVEPIDAGHDPSDDFDSETDKVFLDDSEDGEAYARYQAEREGNVDGPRFADEIFAPGDMNLPDSFWS